MQKIIERISKMIFQREEVLFAYIHGSFLEKEDFKDIDIGVYLDEGTVNEIDHVNFEIDLSLNKDQHHGRRN